MKEFGDIFNPNERTFHVYELLGVLKVVGSLLFGIYWKPEAKSMTVKYFALPSLILWIGNLSAMNFFLSLL